MAGRQDREWSLRDLRSVRMRNLHYKGNCSRLPSTVCILNFQDGAKYFKVQSRASLNTCNPSWFFNMNAVKGQSGWWTRVRRITINVYKVSRCFGSTDKLDELGDIVLQRSVDIGNLMCIGIGRTLHVNPADFETNPGLKARLISRSPGRFPRSESVSIEDHVKGILGPNALRTQSTTADDLDMEARKDTNFRREPFASEDFEERMMHLLQVIGQDAVMNLLEVVRKLGDTKEQCDEKEKLLEYEFELRQDALHKIDRVQQLRMEVTRKREQLRIGSENIERDSQHIRLLHKQCTDHISQVEAYRLEVVDKSLQADTELHNKREKTSSNLRHTEVCCLWLRRLQLLHSLRDIYPLQVRFTESGKVIVIRGLFLPLSSITLNNQDEEQISTAFGFLTHLLFIMSKYLGVSLRYLPLPHGSNASMCDPVKLSQVERMEHKNQQSSGILTMDWLRNPIPHPFVYSQQSCIANHSPGSVALAKLDYVFPLYWKGLDRNTKTKFEKAVSQVKECIQQIVEAWDRNRPSGVEEDISSDHVQRETCKNCSGPLDSEYEVLLEKVDEFVEALRLAISPGATLVPRLDSRGSQMVNQLRATPGNAVAAVASAGKTALSKVLRGNASSTSNRPLISLSDPPTSIALSQTQATD